jgi:molybdopterin-guanine dinucleotide biosynthesis protein A
VSPSPVTALVLCGGRSRRLGPDGADKTAARLGDTTVLDHLLDALPPEWPVVAVGVQRPTVRDVRWARESPAGGGPVAALATGLALVDTMLVVVLAGDMPFAAAAATDVAATLGHDGTTEAAVAVDPDGRANPLLAAYRTAALRHALPDAPANVPARSLLILRHETVAVDALAALDVDTPEALATARRLVLGDAGRP